MLMIQESYVDRTRDCRFGETDWYQPFTDDLGKLYKALRKEYGRCVSKVYVDDETGKAKPVGWVFVKRMPYEDCKDTYLREVWVSYKED